MYYFSSMILLLLLTTCSIFFRIYELQKKSPIKVWDSGIPNICNYSGQLKLYIFKNVHVCPTIKYFPTSRSHTETTNGSGRSCPIQPWSLLSDWMSASILSYVKRVRRIVNFAKDGIKGIHRK